MGRDPKQKGTKNERKSLLGSGGSAGNGYGYNWGEQDCGYILRIIELVTSRGGAIRFGYTRDGGAGSVGVYYGEERDTVYIRPNQNLEEALGVIERAFENFPMTNGKSPEA